MIERINIVKDKLKCPACGAWCKRHSICTRKLRDLGTETERGFLEVTTSKHYCNHCHRHFRNYDRRIYNPRARYTNRAISAAIRLVVRQNKTFAEAQDIMKFKYNVFMPISSINLWIKEAGYFLEAGDED